MIDPASGRIAARAPLEAGPDYVRWNGAVGEVSTNLAVVGVGARGQLELLGAIATAPGAHCVATDDAAGVYVCDPTEGRLLVFRDPYPASAGARPAR
ncbi:MAG TPA: hypothetical protein VFK85_11485 [Anaeromyxobacteraceae bacterium]|nr:hypothetical protein [Anaeromyxobacteraceae bacterium]